MKIITKLSKSGKSKNNIIILEDNPCVSSRASYELLKEYYYNLDEDYFDDYQELQKWLEFREEFLIEQKEINGDLVCKYCGKPHLEIGGRSRKDMSLNNKNPNLATVDHVFPLSKGGPKYDKSNLVVSCKKCNQNKADKII